MKKSTVLIVLLGVLMFGLAGNLFGQSANVLFFDIDVLQPMFPGSNKGVSAEDNAFMAEIILGSTSYTVPVVNGKIYCDQLFDYTYQGAGCIYVYEINPIHDYWGTPLGMLPWNNYIEFMEWSDKYSYDTVKGNIEFKWQ